MYHTYIHISVYIYTHKCQFCIFCYISFQLISTEPPSDSTTPEPTCSALAAIGFWCENLHSWHRWSPTWRYHYWPRWWRETTGPGLPRDFGHGMRMMRSTHPRRSHGRFFEPKVHPWRLAWNIILEVCFRWFSFPNGWFVGSILIFQGAIWRWMVRRWWTFLFSNKWFSGPSPYFSKVFQVGMLDGWMLNPWYVY